MLTRQRMTHSASCSERSASSSTILLLPRSSTVAVRPCGAVRQWRYGRGTTMWAGCVHARPFVKVQLVVGYPAPFPATRDGLQELSMSRVLRIVDPQDLR